MLLVGRSKMNKLILEEDNNKLTTGNYLIEYYHHISLDLEGELTLSHYDTKNNNLNINLADNSNLNLFYVYILNKDLNIDLKVNNNSILNTNFIFLNTGNNKVIININTIGSNNKENIKLRAINKNKDSKLEIICTGIVTKNTCDNELLEDLKGLIPNNSSIKISPNIEVNTNEVMANHLVTIGSFDQSSLFYLKTKGLDDYMAKSLLLKSFLLSNIPAELQEKIQAEVIEFE